MKRYPCSQILYTTVATGQKRHIPFGIPLEGKKVFDIYRISIKFDFIVSVSGVVSLFFGIAHKQFENQTLPLANLTVYGEFSLSYYICSASWYYQVPSETVTEEEEWNFPFKPYTIWCNPTLIAGFVNSGGTMLINDVKSEIHGEIRTPTDEEWKRLQIEQRQEKS